MALEGTQNPNYNPNAAPGTAGSLDPTLNQNPTAAPATPAPPPTPVPASPAATGNSTSSGSGGSPNLPSSNLAPGSQGQDVSALQSYLVQMGYLTPQQVSTGQGIYGPQTTAAVAKLQKDLGINAGSGAGDYGPQTQAALKQKYQNAFSSVQNSTPTDSQAAANTQIQSASQTTTDPVFGAMAASMGPIMESLNQVLNNINNPALTAVSLQQEYNQLAKDNNLPQMQAEKMNMINIMNGTTDDIRQEITSAGGTATESQIMGMTSARNNVILKQYNALSTQYDAAAQNVQNMMQYATSDQQTQLQREQATASVTESMASIESQMVGMGMTMQQNAKQAVQYNVTQTGYSALAASAQGNPQVLSYYEQILNLAPGTLSNPDALSSLDTYKQQQLAIAEQNAQNAGNRTYIYGASQGIPLPGQSTNQTTFGNGTTANFVIPSNALTRPSWLNPNVPLTMSSNDMTSYAGTVKGAVIGGSAGSSSYGNNVTIPGVGNYVAQPDGSYILGSAIPQELSSQEGVSGLISSLSNPNPPTLNYSDIAAIMQNAPGSQYPPASTAFYREQRSARQLLGNFTGSPVYATVSQAPLPFARIQAARSGDNSVSDTELLDSYITLAKGQGQITEAQIAAITGASSISDKLNIIKQKVVGAGALISADQRKSLLSLSGSVFDQYSTQYKNLYTQAINVLAKNHMEPAVWGVIPDFTTMITTGDTFANSEPQ